MLHEIDDGAADAGVRSRAHAAWGTKVARSPALEE